MIEYYILLEYKRLMEERNRLEAKLQKLEYRRTVTRCRDNKIYYFQRSHGTENIRERAISHGEYLSITEENSEYMDTKLRLRNICADMTKLEPHISKSKEKVNTEFEKLCLEAREKNTKFRISNYKPDSLRLVSVRGDIVRSKSELIIADCLYFSNIYYEYEAPDIIDGFHPDFCIRDNLRGITILWEHFGKMNDPSYAGDFARKQKELARNGFLPGYNLITTFEYYDSVNSDRSVIVDSNHAESIINKWFMPSSFAA